MRRISFTLFIVYLGLSPVYWWPGISAEAFAATKFALIAAAIIIVWFSALDSGSLGFPAGVLGPIGLILLLVTAAGGIAQADTDISIRRIKDFMFGFIMLWTFFMYRRMRWDASRIFIAAALIVAAHCLLVFSSKLIGIPDWSGPSDFIAPELWVSGFGGMRTGWSNGTAFFVPVLAAFVFLKRGVKPVTRLFFAAAIVSIIASQIIVGGRAGLLASVIAIFLMLKNRQNKLVMLTIGSVVILSGYLLSDFLYTQLRMERLDSDAGSSISIESLDYFSAGRVSSNIKAIDYALERPFTGYGFGSVTFSGTEIHNLWLRMFVECGILLPLMFLLMVIILLKNVSKNPLLKLKNVRDIKKLTLEENDYLVRVSVCRAVFIIGLLMSMFEPNILLGSFQNSAIWWACAGVAAAEMRAARVQKQKLRAHAYQKSPV